MRQQGGRGKADPVVSRPHSRLSQACAWRSRIPWHAPQAGLLGEHSLRTAQAWHGFTAPLPFEKSPTHARCAGSQPRHAGLRFHPPSHHTACKCISRLLHELPELLKVILLPVGLHVLVAAAVGWLGRCHEATGRRGQACAQRPQGRGCVREGCGVRRGELLLAGAAAVAGHARGREGGGRMGEQRLQERGRPGGAWRTAGAATRKWLYESLCLLGRRTYAACGFVCQVVAPSEGALPPLAGSCSAPLARPTTTQGTTEGRNPRKRQPRLRGR